MKSSNEKNSRRCDSVLALGLFGLTLLVWKLIVDEYAGTGIALFALAIFTLAAGFCLGVRAQSAPIKTALVAQGWLLLPMTLMNVAMFLWPYVTEQLIKRGAAASPGAVFREMVENPRGDIYGLAFAYFMAWNLLWMLAGGVGAGLGGWYKVRKLQSSQITQE